MDGLIDNVEWTPKYGMEFESDKKAYEFYNEYGRRLGFSIRKHTHVQHNNSAEITSAIFVCSKQGVRRSDNRDYLTKKPRAHTRTGCDARMSIKLNRTLGKYCVNDFMEQHNHPLVQEVCSHLLPSQRKVTDTQAIEVLLAEESRIALKNAHELMSRQAGGREALGFTREDQKNYLRSKRQRQLAFGEARSIIDHFQRKRIENPSFFYAFQLDSEEQITNIFWADAKMIIDYGHFGDALSFDTTYKINKANRPFAVFVGFNHHRETVVFGAALMYDETAASFSWLFRIFLDCMSKKAPKCIFTDEDAAMARAISEVMPDTYHRLCIWHIMQNAIKHVSSVFACHGGVKSVLSRFMEEYEDEKEFLAAWDQMIEEYNLKDNSWLARLFQSKKKWAYAYVRMAWSAKMKSTQLSESFNAKLKDYLKSDHNVVQFFMHFERVLNDVRYRELVAEYSMVHKLPQVIIPVKWLKHAGDVYTKIFFEEFQLNYFLSLELVLKEKKEDEYPFMYTVSNRGTHGQREIKREMDGSISCSCRMWEIVGILCSHAIKVLKDEMQIMEIPDQYILKRWTKKARSDIVQDMQGRNIEADVKLQQNAWHRSMSYVSNRLICRAAESEDTTNLYLEHMKELSQIIEGMLSLKMDTVQTTQSVQPQTNEGEVNQETQVAIQAKGFKKKQSTHRGKRRTKSQLEIAMKKKRSRSKSHAIEGNSGRNQPTTTTDVYSHSPSLCHQPVGIDCTPTLDVYRPCPPQLDDAVPWITDGESQNVMLDAIALEDMRLGFPFDDSQASNAADTSKV